VSQRSCRLAAQRQQPHQRAVAALAQRLDRDLAARIVDRLPILRAPLGPVAELLERAERGLVQLRALHQRPLVERRAVA
jgi:hypothetical protein